ncbi:sodium:proton antiporter [Rhodococcus sp. Eu-32]|uniref:cation:proton antiporter n=1 Tax=Rhodococcus sp. Eu-32 TaxID=1017319 RepID=UPI000DF3C0F5|nr:sodium:proton antiporter [Rhodococcus sp. Eu-32]RRQ27640.1 sodium:proton antiporter [Rhodococcus sp. Eu-32]
MDILIVMVAGLLAIAAASMLGERIGVAAPLLLVLLGIGISLMPFVPDVEIDPEWILAGVLPPLLYSASVSMPTMDFRREFGAIGGLSVLLVVVSAIVLGSFFSWVIPDLNIWWGIALGAIVSPTDAVATSIVRGLPVSKRVVSILEGEGLLNDATALVLLRTAIAGAAASVSLLGVIGDFVFAVAVAAVIGLVVGHLNLKIRSKVTDSTVNTVISFTVPFLAAVPAEELGASGLVAAVVAGLVTGHGAPRSLSPRHRLSDTQNWRAVELVLEGAVFLTMGLELSTIVADVNDDHRGIGTAALVAAGALVVTILVRAAFVAPLIRLLRRRAARFERLKPKLYDAAGRLDGHGETYLFRGRRQASESQIARFRTRIRRGLADIDYFLAAPLDWRDGTVVVWAGMRGAVTLAAAQTLPEDTPARSLLVLVAFLVAVGSLLLQGGTLKRVVGWVTPTGAEETEEDDAQREGIRRLLAEAAAPLDGQSRWEQISAQRTALLDARDDGLFDAESLEKALNVLDAEQIGLELRRHPEG